MNKFKVSDLICLPNKPNDLYIVINYPSKSKFYLDLHEKGSGRMNKEIFDIYNINEGKFEEFYDARPWMKVE